MTDAQTQYIGIGLLAIGVLLGLVKRKRKFDRTNEFGVERFSSYWSKLSLKIKDGLLGGIAILFLSSGLLTLAIQNQDTWGWIVVLPVSLFILYLIF
jgi:hypothetical protein